MDLNECTRGVMRINSVILKLQDEIKKVFNTSNDKNTLNNIVLAYKASYETMDILARDLLFKVSDIADDESDPNDVVYSYVNKAKDLSLTVQELQSSLKLDKPDLGDVYAIIKKYMGKYFSKSEDDTIYRLSIAYILLNHKLERYLLDHPEKDRIRDTLSMVVRRYQAVNLYSMVLLTKVVHPDPHNGDMADLLDNKWRLSKIINIYYNDEYLNNVASNLIKTLPIAIDTALS